MGRNPTNRRLIRDAIEGGGTSGPCGNIDPMFGLVFELDNMLKGFRKMK